MWPCRRFDLVELVSRDPICRDNESWSARCNVLAIWRICTATMADSPA